MPRLLVLGPTGGTGLALVTQALAAGHAVTVLVRTPAKLSAAGSPPHPRLSVVRGDATCASDVAAAVSAAGGSQLDGVAVCLGHRVLMLPESACSVGTRCLLDALAAAGAQPCVVVCSSMGVGESAPHMPAFVRWLMKFPIADKALQEVAVRRSGLRHCVVRPAGFIDAPPRGLAACTAVPDGAPTPTTHISRADCAAFMLARLHDMLLQAAEASDRGAVGGAPAPGEASSTWCVSWAKL